MNNTDNNQNKKQGGEEQLSAESMLKNKYPTVLDLFDIPIAVFSFKDSIELMESYASQFKSKNLCVEDCDFIESALNNYWHDAVINLARKDLGDIEKKNYESQLHKSKELMQKIDSIGFKQSMQLFATQSKNNTDSERVDVEELAAEIYPYEEKSKSIGVIGEVLTSLSKENIDSKRKCFISGYKAALSSLQGANGLVKENEWISVEVDLPKLSGEYLVYGKCTGESYFTCDMAMFDINDGLFRKAYQPLFWQPLPQAPKTK